MLRWRRSFPIFKKEMCDILRDRRTVFMAVIFPLILYPLLIIGIIQATLVHEAKTGHEVLIVAVAGARFAPGVVGNIEDDEGLEVAEFVKDSGRFGARGAVAAAFFPRDFRDALGRGATARIKIYYDSADPRSAAAMEKLTSILRGADEYILAKRLEGKNLPREFTNPLALDIEDIATARQRGAIRIGQILAFLLVVLCMMGALYPALDAISGEKERGTLETLLSIPATRLEILAGKYAAVFAMSVTSVLSNFLSLSATLFMVNVLLKSQPAGDAPVDFTVPFSAFFLFLPALLPLAGLFSALTLGVASFARSTREGQYYLGPLYAAVLPLTAVALAPGLRLTWGMAFVPVLSTALFLKEGLMSTLSVGPGILSLALTCLYAAVALKWAASVFSREEVLFASPTTEVSPAAAVGYARPAHVLFVWAISVILFFFVGQALLVKHGLVNPLVAAAIYVGCILAPALIWSAVSRLNWRKLFPFRAPSGAGWASIVLYVAAAILLGIAAKGVQTYFLPAPKTASTAESLQDVSVWALFISLAFLPAVCEELFYRGFIYRSLASRLRPAGAIFLSAALFSVGHLNPYNALPYIVLGVVLALAARRSGGLAAPMAVHFCHNAFSLLVTIRTIDLAFLTREIQGWRAVVFVVILAAAGGALVWAAGRVARGRGGEID